MGARYSAEGWAEHAESLGPRRGPGLRLSPSVYISTRPSVHVFNRGYTCVCLCGVRVVCMCACVGQSECAPRRQRGPRLSRDFVPLKPLCPAGSPGAWAGWGTKSDIKVNFFRVAVSSFWCGDRQCLVFPFPFPSGSSLPLPLPCGQQLWGPPGIHYCHPALHRSDPGAASDPFLGLDP